jgi:hypothetical protein
MSGPPLRIFQWSGQLRKGTSARKGKVEMGGGDIGISELPRLDFLQFQHDFRSFSDKKGLLLGGQNPPVYMLKEALNNVTATMLLTKYSNERGTGAIN